jgi:hypothetical protein
VVVVCLVSCVFLRPVLAMSALLCC